MRCTIFNCSTSDANSLFEMISLVQLGTFLFPFFLVFFFFMDNLQSLMPSMFVKIEHLDCLGNPLIT